MGLPEVESGQMAQREARQAAQLCNPSGYWAILFTVIMSDRDRAELIWTCKSIRRARRQRCLSARDKSLSPIRSDADRRTTRCRSE